MSTHALPAKIFLVADRRTASVAETRGSIRRFRLARVDFGPAARESLQRPQERGPVQA
jgi:hypothetical protein